MRPPLDAAWLQQRGYRLDGDRAVPATSTGPVPEMPEDTLLATVRRLAKLYGWTIFHVFDSRRSEHGYPDVTLVRPGRLIFAELKSQHGKLTREQDTWLSLLAHSIPGIEVYCWRPADLQQIVHILSR